MVGKQKKHLQQISKSWEIFPGSYLYRELIFSYDFRGVRSALIFLHGEEWNSTYF